MHCW